MNQAYPVEIDVLALDRLRREGAQVCVLDVREGWEREICTLPESLHIPMASVPAQLDRLPRDGFLVVLCHHGVRSARVANWLRGQGVLNAVNLAGGIDAWAREVDGSMGVY